jgi:hypothetical protein
MGGEKLNLPYTSRNEKLEEIKILLHARETYLKIISNFSIANFLIYFLTPHPLLNNDTVLYMDKWVLG